jgi:hypothetical protein
MIVNCGGGYQAVKRPHEDWRMEKADSGWDAFYNSTAKTDQLKSIMRDWQAEYAKFVKEGAVVFEPGDSPCYIQYPDIFDNDLEYVMQFSGELSPADEAWIRNTRELIEKYHRLYEKGRENYYLLRKRTAPQGGDKRR